MPRRGNRGPALLPGDGVDADGRYVYLPDGPTDFELPGIDFVLTPNHALERGARLEGWLPGYAIDWGVPSRFRFDADDEAAAEAARGHGEYAVFYCGPLAGCTRDGHNRGPRWRPEQWVELGDRLRAAYGVRVVVIGADYDRSYYDGHVRPLLGAREAWWDDAIGVWPIATTFAVCRRARLVAAYQSGLAIFSHYLGANVVSWWRQDGDSISPHVKLCFDERMASAWANPDLLAAGKYLPGYYGRTGVDEIMTFASANKW